MYINKEQITISSVLQEYAELKTELENKQNGEFAELMRFSLVYDENWENVWQRQLVGSSISSGTYEFGSCESSMLKQEREQLKNIGSKIQAHEKTKPQAKEQQVFTKNSSRRNISSWIFLGIFVVLFIVSIILFVQGNNSRSEFYRITEENQVVNGILDNPGTAWDEWTELWNIQGMTWQALGQNWMPVEMNWQTRGLHITWEYMTNVRNRILGNIIQLERFRNDLFNQIRADFTILQWNPNYPIEFGFAIALLILGFLALILPATKLLLAVSRRNKIRNKILSYNKDIEKYNLTQLPVDLIEHEKISARLHTEFNAQFSKTAYYIPFAIQTAEAQIESISKEIGVIKNKMAHENFRAYPIQDFSTYKLRTLAKILSERRAESFKEALNIYTEDEHRKEMQRLQQEQIEQERKAANELAESNRIAQQKIYKQQQQHNAEMKRIATETAEQQADAARQHARDMQKQANKQLEETKKLNNMISCNCSRCKKASTCGWKGKYSTCGYFH